VEGSADVLWTAGGQHHCPFRVRCSESPNQI
jgi:hypothetical protein